MRAFFAFLRKISDSIEQTPWLNSLLYLGASLVLAGVCLFLGYLVGMRQEQGSGLRILSQAQQLVQQHFYGEVPEERTLEYGMIHGMLATLNDPYSGFSEPVNAELQQNDMAGRFGGIGCTIQRNEQGDVLLSPYRESPAALAGIPDQAVLLSVDGQAISAETTLDAVVALVRGEVGTTVRIGFRTPQGETQEVSITRAEFEIPSTTWHTLPDQPQIGYIQILRFSARTAEETAQALDELQAAGVSGLILDLRDNGGGLLDSAVDVFALFTPGGTVLIEEAKNAAPKTYTAPNKQKTTLPVLLLVNQNTASASEILAGALQDHQRAQLVGVKTFGKGSVQFVFELADHSSIRITHAHWFTPNHNPIHEVGLTPDFVVENDPNQPNNDVQLAKALEILTR